MGNICIHDDGKDLPYRNRSCSKCGAPYKTYHNSRYSHRLSCRKHQFSKKNKNYCIGCRKIITPCGPHNCYHY